MHKYLSLCPPNYTKKAHFYLQSLKSPHPKQWFGRECMGANKIKEVVKELLSSAKIDGYFTNHSLRRTGGTHLFQSGVDRKLVKEVTGHRSDAVDAYKLTSDAQREAISKIMAGKVVQKSLECEKIKPPAAQTDKGPEKSSECNCVCSNHKTLNIGTIVNEMISKNLKSGKTVIKLEIEIANE